MERLHITLIAGTRPEAIKLAPLVRVLRARPSIRTTLLLSGQHPMMAREALAEFDLAADLDLAVANPSMPVFCAQLASELSGALEALAPDMVLVQGDTNTAWVGALSASRLGIAVGHVEAGLRSGDLLTPWPEERNRREIDVVSTLLFTPCRRASIAVAGFPGIVHETGNTGIDALVEALDGQLTRAPREGRHRILATCHRRESISFVAQIALALRRLADRPDVALSLPLHPNPAFAETLGPLLSDHPNICLDAPMPYRALVRRLRETDLLLTDSGGLQEEAAALGLPTLVLRSTTERPETIEHGCAKLIGASASAILTEATLLLDDPAPYALMARPCFPYGAGFASEHIADAIEAWWRSTALPFPWARACSKGAGHGRTDYGDELGPRELAPLRSEAAARLS